ncbi:MBL fold metallo-hydrolase [Deinococcus detaillensis]|uniref:MBL fold metallo-hydrolase n=1 Tax=Deinococcus detaillensis TaxID=2592048 RepID=A0A553V6J0_9DEIO|nr:MBL fold metallo-hydrolase [Deinococcus detaillensis]TSA88093.1 MBL fold metallo-hydrolase [Deinococcus detaillensis]
MTAAAHPPALHHLRGTLYAALVPIPLPMKTVTVLIDLSPPVTLIDTSINTPEARQALEAALSALGLHWPDIERVIVTHIHPDHYGLAGLIEERSGASVQMLDHSVKQERLWSDWERQLPAQHQFFAEHGAPPNFGVGEAQTSEWVRPAVRLTPLQAGQQVTLDGADWQVLWLPGHADGHLGLWQPETEMLIAGDAILPRITPNIGLYVGGRPDPLGDYFATLENIRALGPVQAVVGHYGPTMDKVAARAQEIHGHHLERLDELLVAVRERPRHAYDLSFVLFARELPPSGRRFAVAETLAHAEYLRLGGAVQRSWVDGVWQYHD